MENLQEEGRGCRQRKKQSDPIFCPVCGITLRNSELEQHYELEIERLGKLQLNQKVRKSLNNGNGYHDPLPGCSSNNEVLNGCPYVTFQKIRNNRHSRLRAKTRKRKADEPVCPICNERPTEEINRHVEMCLKKNEGLDHANGDDSDDESIDIEGEYFEEYEWAGQKRIRASTLLQGGYSSIGVGTSICNCSNDIEEDLNVDGDDTHIYGSPQFTDKDVILPLNHESNKEEKENMYLRKLVTGQDYSNISLNNSPGNSSRNAEGQIIISEENSCKIIKSENNLKHKSNSLLSTIVCSTNSSQNVNQVTESLKAKIREYENQISNKLKCLICMDEFRKPAVSICCWHVHCEECWLRTLGTRKLCPQCNMITSPIDLRRIYM